METEFQERIIALERQNRRSRRLLWIAGALLLALTLAVIEAHREIWDFRRFGLQTTAVELFRPSGEKLAGLGSHPQGGRPYFKFVDDGDRYRVFLALEESGPSLTFADSEGRVRLRLAVDDEGGVVELLDEQGDRAWSAP